MTDVVQRRPLVLGLKVLWGIVAGLFAFLGLFALFSDPLPGICLLAFGVAAFPWTWRLRGARLVPVIGRWGIGFALFIFFAVAISYSEATHPARKTGDRTLAERRTIPQPKTTAQPTLNYSANVKARYDQIIRTVGECDHDGKVVAESSSGSDFLAKYEMARHAKESCQEASIKVGQLDAPNGLPRDKKAPFQKAISDLSLAYFARSEGYDKLATALDGNMKPSVLVDMKKDLQMYQGTLTRGLMEYIVASEAVGVRIDRLHPANGKQEQQKDK